MQEQVTSNAKMIEDALAQRFGVKCPVDPALPGLDELARIARHRVHRRFLPRAVAPELSTSLRLRVVGAVQERPAASRYPGGARQGQAEQRSPR